MNRVRSTLRLSSVPAVLLTLVAQGAGGGAAGEAWASAHAKPPAGRSVTTTTVMGGGSPATWPAAKPYPPSLAGAYSPNMKTAFIALTNYSDWVGTHPNPALVKNYASPTSNIYAVQVYLMKQMWKRELHLPPTPTTIDFLAVVKAPTLRRSKYGRPLKVNGHRAYTDGTIDVVVDQVTEPYLDSHDHVVGYTARGTGPKPWSITLGQNSIGQFVIMDYYGIIIHGSLTVWEKEVSKRS
jgi:hypothetical protein